MPRNREGSGCTGASPSAREGSSLALMPPGVLAQRSVRRSEKRIGPPLLPAFPNHRQYAARYVPRVPAGGDRPDIVVISPLRDWTCAECGDSGELLLVQDNGPLCMRCADLGHLVFLPAGDSALTRRARRASRLSAPVVRFSRARKRYERQGVLVEEPALASAEAECLADAEVRARRRERDKARRGAQDLAFQSELAREIVRLYPGCPPDRATEIAHHTGARGSGRVGRSAAGRDMDPDAVRLAVAASVRHRDTDYDELLMAGIDRSEARWRVTADVDRILATWQQPAR